LNHLVHTATGDILVENLLIRATFCGRLGGLLLRKEMNVGSGMLLVAARRVHTFGMLFPLDLYFFNASMRLIGSLYCVMPWRMPGSPKGTQHILEIHHKTTNEPLRLDFGEQASILWKVKP